MASLRFLTRDEMKVLTGYSQPKRQIELLSVRRIPFNLDAYGRPVVYAEACTGAPPPISMYDQAAVRAELVGGNP